MMLFYVENIIKLFSLKLPNHQKVDWLTVAVLFPEWTSTKGMFVLSPPFLVETYCFPPVCSSIIKVCTFNLQLNLHLKGEFLKIWHA